MTIFLFIMNQFKIEKTLTSVVTFSSISIAIFISAVESAQASTPEPTTVIGFITLGGVLLGSKRKTKG